MPVLRESLKGESPPFRFARSFQRHVGLKLSHIAIVAAALAAMYLATESYSGDAGYASPGRSDTSEPRR